MAGSHSKYIQQSFNSKDEEEKAFYMAPSSQCGGIHLVVFGKSGSGKSSLCNQLIGDRSDLIFHVERNLKVVTLSCTQFFVNLYGYKYTVMDTPGHDSDSDMIQVRSSYEKLITSLQKHITPNYPGRTNKAHGEACKVVIIFCVRCDARYAREEHETYMELKWLWGNDLDFCQRLVVVFTHGDNLKEDGEDNDSVPEELKMPIEENGLGCEPAEKTDETTRSLQPTSETTPEEEILAKKLTQTWEQLQQLLRDANRKYVLFNNKKGHKDERAVRKLLDMVKKMELSASPCFVRQNQRGEKQTWAGQAKEDRRRWGSLSLEWKVAAGVCVFVIVAAFVFLVTIVAVLGDEGKYGGLVPLLFTWLLGYANNS